MSTTTPGGLTIPNRDGSDHNRHWEHYAALGDTMDARLPRQFSTGQGVGGVPVAPGATYVAGNDALTPIGPRRVGSTLLCNLSMAIRICEAASVQTADLRLVSLVGCSVILDDYYVERFEAPQNYVEPIIRRAVLLQVTGTAGTSVTPSARFQVSVGTGPQRLVVWRVTNLIAAGQPA